MFAFFDIDGTLLATSLERTLLRFLWTHGQIRWRAVGRAVRERLRRRRWSGSDWKSLYLTGIAEAELDRLLPLWWEQHVAPALYRDMLAGMAFLRTRGWQPVLVSGTLEVLATFLAERLGGARVLATPVATNHGVFTGTLRSAPVTGVRKWHRIRDLLDATGVDPRVTWGFGNRWSDVPFLTRIGFPVAVHPDRRLRAHARRAGWPILYPGAAPIAWDQLWQRYLAQRGQKDHDR